MIIYKTTNKVNGKFYVGRDSKNDPHYLGSGKILKRAIKKYGKENFVKEILEEYTTLEEAIKAEEYFIKKLNATKLGYNISNKGVGFGTGENNPMAQQEIREKNSKSHMGKKHTEEHKGKISESIQGEKNPMWGKKRPDLSMRMKNNNPMKQPEFSGENHPAKRPEVRAKLSKILKGKRKSAEHRKKLSIAIKGKKLSEETRKKISIGNKGKKLSEETKKKMSIAKRRSNFLLLLFKQSS